MLPNPNILSQVYHYLFQVQIIGDLPSHLVYTYLHLVECPSTLLIKPTFSMDLLVVLLVHSSPEVPNKSLGTSSMLMALEKKPREKKQNTLAGMPSFFVDTQLEASQTTSSPSPGRKCHTY